MQDLMNRLRDTLQNKWSCQSLTFALNPLIPVPEFYQDACLPAHAATGSYKSHFLSQDLVLRKQLADSMPSLLRKLSAEPPEDMILVGSGPVYQEARGRMEPHDELEIWRLLSHDPGLGCLDEMEEALGKVLPKGTRLRQRSGQKPHLVYARRIEAYTRQGWVRIGYCGVVSLMLLIDAGFDSASAHALALTLDADRCLSLGESQWQDAARYTQDSYL